jgi:hypothetical protein
MKENPYEIEYIELNDDLNNINMGKFHYNYLGIDFMLNYKEKSEKLLIVFHARVDTNDKIPVFHKHNYEKEKISVLSISDKILEKYQHINSTCYIDLPGENYHDKYNNIIKYTIEKIKAQKNIFYGSCSGAFPAIHFGSLFNETILCTNSYLYIENFETLYNKRAGFAENKFIYFKLEETVKNNHPKHIYLYVNKNDDEFVYKQNIKFIKFCKDHIPDKITYKIHDTYQENFKCHFFYFPEKEDFGSVLNSI